MISAISEWIKNFLILYFFLTLMLYLLPKDSYRKYLRFAVKMILLTVLFLPLLRRLGSEESFFSIVEEMEDYRQDDGWSETKKWEELQDEYVKERSGYYEEHFGESEQSDHSGASGSADSDSGHTVGGQGEDLQQ